MKSNGGQMIVLDSGSVSRACPPWLVGELTIGESREVQLVGIQKQPIKSYRKPSILLRNEGYDEEASASVKFDVADVAYPVLGVWRLIYTSLGEHASYMAKGRVWGVMRSQPRRGVRQTAYENIFWK